MTFANISPELGRFLAASSASGVRSGLSLPMWAGVATKISQAARSNASYCIRSTPDPEFGASMTKASLTTLACSMLKWHALAANWFCTVSMASIWPVEGKQLCMASSNCSDRSARASIRSWLSGTFGGNFEMVKAVGLWNGRSSRALSPVILVRVELSNYQSPCTSPIDTSKMTAEGGTTCLEAS